MDEEYKNILGRLDGHIQQKLADIARNGDAPEPEAPEADQDASAKASELAKLHPLEYAKVRKAEADKLGIAVTFLDDAVKAQRKKSAKAAKPEPEFNPEELERSATAIINNDSILDLFAEAFGKVIAGEATNGKLLYLVATSRLFDKTMNAAIKGTSAGGKSEIRKRVLDFFPPESVVSFTSLSEKALIYYDGDFAHKILSMGEASAAEEQTFQDYLLRELMSEGRIRYPTVQKVGGELCAITIDKNGPVAFLVTTTRNKLHAENETRMLSLEIDDSEGQTKNVLRKVAQVEGLNHASTLIDYKPWLAFQRWLERGERRVVVPFAGQLIELIPPAAVRLRRDVGQVIRAIKAHALLHRDRRGHDQNKQIIADIAHDYETVRELLEPILAEGSGVAVHPAMTETVQAVTEATVGLTESEGASAQNVARILKLDKSAARRRLLGAREEGFVINLEVRRGMPGKYRATPQTIEALAILPTPERLRQAVENTHVSVTPPEPVPPCHRDEKADTVQDDNGGKDGGKPVVGGGKPVVDGKPVANDLATVKPLDTNVKSSPVAGWQRFSGETGGTVEKESDDFKICAYCGKPGGTEVWYGDRQAFVHPHCRQAWIAAQDGVFNQRLRLVAGSSQ
jgi:hypothetical protein